MNMKFDILKYLDDHRITLAEAARAAGMAPQNIRKCLEGNPKVGNILAIANGLNIDIRDFFYPDTTEADTAADAPQDGLFAQQGEQEKEDAKAEGDSQAQDAREMMYCPHCGTKFFVVNVPNRE